MICYIILSIKAMSKSKFEEVMHNKNKFAELFDKCFRMVETSHSEYM